MMNAQLGKKGTLKLAVLSAVLLMSAAACSSPAQKVERYTKSGQEYLHKGDQGRAKVQFQNALKINEEYVPALSGLAQIAENRQDYGALFGTLQRIVRLEPNNVDALVKMAKIYLIGSEETDALETVEKALKISPGDAGAMAVKAAVLLKLEDTAGAVDLAAKSLAIDSTNPEATTVMATERAMAGDNEGALAQIDAGLKADSKSAILQLLRLQLLSNLGRDQEQDEGHRKLIELAPDNVGYRQLYVSYLLDHERTKEARDQLVEIVRLSPGKVDPMVDVVRVDYRAGGAAAAKKSFETYVKEQPKNIDLKFAYAAFLRQEGDRAGAESIYTGYVQAKGDDALIARAKNEIATNRLLEGNIGEAKKIVDEILAKDAQNTDALMKRATLKIDAKDYDSAIADLRTALVNKPDAYQAKLLMGSAFEGKGDVALAESQMSEAFADSKNDANVAALFSSFLVRRDNIARAQKVLTESLERHPDSVDNLKRLAGVQLMLQDWKGAEDTAKRIEELSEGEPAAKRILGAAYAGLKDYGGAIAALTEAQSAAPLATRPLATLVAAYIQDGRAGEAESMLSRMLSSDAKNYPARLMLAQTQQAQKKDADAEATLKGALKAAPDRVEAAESLYRIYRGSDRMADAEAMLNAQMAAAPQADGYKMLKADLLIATARPLLAVAIYQEVLKRRPKDQLAANNYASLLLELKDDAQSRATALQAASALEGSENPFFLDTLGWARHLNGDHSGAVAALEKAAAGAPGSAEVQYHLGAAYLGAGNAEKGRSALQRAVAGAGDAAYVKKARELLAQH